MRESHNIESGKEQGASRLKEIGRCIWAVLSVTPVVDNLVTQLREEDIESKAIEEDLLPLHPTTETLWDV